MRKLGRGPEKKHFRVSESQATPSVAGDLANVNDFQVPTQENLKLFNDDQGK